MPILKVPLVTQWGIQANFKRTDCGPSCVLMVLEYYNKRGDLTVDKLSAETTLVARDNGLTPGQLVSLGAKHGLKLRVQFDTTEAQIKNEIDNGRPVIALIAYRFILGRLDQRDNKPGSDGHFVVVVGYDDTHFVIDDPDNWAPFTEKGHNFLAPVTELMQAIIGAGSFAQCIFSEETDMATQADVDALKRAFASMQASVDASMNNMMAAINAIPVAGPVIDPPVIPPTTKTIYVIARDGAYVRATPSPTGAVKTALKFMSPVNVLTPAANGWFKIADGPNAGNYITANTTFVSDGG